MVLSGLRTQARLATHIMPRETIVIAADHGGMSLKAVLKEVLSEMGYEALDLGTYGPEPVDYPDYADALVQAMKEGKAARGVLVCGSGIGVSIRANRYPGIRAALCHDAVTARLARQHNDANVLVLGERLTGVEVAKDCLRVFLTTAFEGGRHARRVEKLG
jgi:ribose 5-phosphate isomerase B